MFGKCFIAGMLIVSWLMGAALSIETGRRQDSPIGPISMIISWSLVTTVPALVVAFLLWLIV